MLFNKYQIELTSIRNLRYCASMLILPLDVWAQGVYLSMDVSQTTVLYC